MSDLLYVLLSASLDFFFFFGVFSVLYNMQCFSLSLNVLTFGITFEFILLV